MNGHDIASWATPSDHHSLGDWLRSLRGSMRLNGDGMARLIGVHAQTIYNWENNNNRPKLRFLRVLRDNLQLSSHILTAALHTFYARKNFEVREWPPSEPFWRLIATNVGSVEERRLRSDLLERHQRIAGSVAHRYRGYRDFDDLRQEALIGLAAAIPGYIPSMGPLPPYAAAYCRGRVLQYLRESYYVDVDRELWEPFTAVRRAIRTPGQTGEETSDAALSDQLKLPLSVIQDARSFLARRRFSLDTTWRDDSRSSYDVVGETPQEFGHADLCADLDRVLADFPGAAQIVIAHVMDEKPLSQIAEQARVSTAEIQGTFDKACGALRESGLIEALIADRGPAA